MFKKLGYAAFALVAIGGIGIAGTWNTQFPIINGASYCGSTVNNSCVSTIPAGPALTGSETIPADTNLTAGQNPQTAIIPIRVLGGGATQYSVPVTTNTVTIAATTRQVIVNPAGTIAALTLTFPAATGLLDGQRIGFCTTQIITTLTTNAGSGTTLSNAPSAMLVPVATGAASCVEWIYVASATTWFRTQ
jgi:hypothetical protein